MNGSYQLQSFTENRESEIKRLKSQVELFFENEFAIYKEIGLTDGMKVIECGSGPGFLILNLISKFPNCEYTALEIDPYLFETLKKNSKDGDKDLFKTIQGSIYSTEQADNTFDVAITRLVIEHLDKPLDAFRELLRILKPGGKLIVISNDFEYHVLTYPHIPELDEMYKAYCKSRVDQGGNPYVGRQIPAFFEELGVHNISFNVTTAHNKILGDQALQKAENINISRNLVKDGYLKQETLDALSNKWFDMLQHPGHIVFRQLFVISGEKPSGDSNKESHATTTVTENELTLESLSKTDEQTRKSILIDFLIQNLVDFMDDDSAEIDPSTKLSEYYIDSLVATDMASLLKTNFQTELKLADILQNYNINDIADCVITNIQKKPDIQNNMEQSSWSEGEI